MKKYLILFAVIIFAIPAQLYSADTTFTQIKLQLNWIHQFQFAGYYAAIEKGYYKDVGLEVELIEANSTELPGDAVINGKADFGTGTSDVVLMRGNGKPVVVLATIFQHSAQILLATEVSGIRYVHNLSGKRLIIEPHAADIIAYMSDEGISLNNIEKLPPSFDVNMIIENKADAMTAYVTDEPFVLKKQNIAYNILSPISGCIDFYGDILITSEQLLIDNPKLAKDFRDASLKGWEYAMENSDELIELIYNKYSKRHSKEHLTFEAEGMKKLILSDVIEIGYSNPRRWQKIIDTYKRTGMLDNKLNINGLLYTDYLKKELDIPWKLIVLFSFILLFFVSIAMFFYKMSIRLKSEINHSKQIHKTLIVSEKKLLDSNKTKDKFFSIIAHDLRSPFNSMLGFSKMLNKNFDKYDTEKQKKLLGFVHIDIQNTYKLLENLLLWSRSQQGVIDFKPKKETLYLLFVDIIEVLKQSAKNKSITLTNQISKNLNVNADIDMFSTIIRNLISNAIKFTPRGGEILINARSITDENKQGFAEITVKDNGVGISKEIQSKLFDIGENRSTEGTENEEGTGLGLILCKEFVEKHGGKIWVESEVGTGSSFVFTLPE